MYQFERWAEGGVVTALCDMSVEEFNEAVGDCIDAEGFDAIIRYPDGGWMLVQEHREGRAYYVLADRGDQWFGTMAEAERWLWERHSSFETAAQAGVQQHRVLFRRIGNREWSTLCNRSGAPLVWSDRKEAEAAAAAVSGFKVGEIEARICTTTTARGG